VVLASGLARLEALRLASACVELVHRALELVALHLLGSHRRAQDH
jgi:hypothetical protein